MKRNPISCRDTTWLVSDARERELTAGEAQDLGEHVSTCPYCRNASVQFQVLFKQLGVYFGRPDDEAGQ